MADLMAGDLVLSGDSTGFARVVVNQHRVPVGMRPMLTIEHTHGSLTLTPDHVLLVDGTFVTAREVTPGALLGAPSAVVSRVSESAAPIVNPITTSARILAAGPGSGAPVLASTHPEWIADVMLAAGAFPLTLSGALSYLFPATTQAYYDSWIELVASAANLPTLKEVVGPPDSVLFAVQSRLFDFAISTGLFAFAASQIKVASLMAITCIATAYKL